MSGKYVLIVVIFAPYATNTSNKNKKAIDYTEVNTNNRIPPSTARMETTNTKSPLYFAFSHASFLILERHFGQ
jgi:hypothetical protein